jgi:hypothetical protein
MKTQSFVALGAWILATAFSTMAVSASENTDAAVAAANQWLGLVDAKQYGKSWQESAPIFQSSVTKAQWEQAANSVRTPLGAMKTRTMSTAEYRTTLPGAPDGEYVVIQFKTSFANKAESIETVTPMKAGGVWKVSGYFIK